MFHMWNKEINTYGRKWAIILTQCAIEIGKMKRRNKGNHVEKEKNDIALTRDFDYGGIALGYGYSEFDNENGPWDLWKICTKCGYRGKLV